jgi:hypothetical protein
MLASGQLGPNTNIEGLLYVPDLRSQDESCQNLTRPFVPGNVTRSKDFPSADEMPRFAIAPWVSANCSHSYMESAAIAANIRGFIFYLSSRINTQNYSSAAAPLFNDAAWNIPADDRWRVQSDYPVYGINSDAGALIMDELSQYSGSINNAPSSSALVEQFGENNFVRLYVSVEAIQSNGGSNLPRIWVFLVILLCLVLAMVALTSVVMHCIQRRRRRNLQDRIAEGLVDVENLGIKRVKVPQSILDKLPIYVYGERTSSNSGPAVATRSGVMSPSKPSDDTSVSVVGNVTPVAEVFSQPSCAICLEDFVVGETSIRSLPCAHIYHAACIDALLKHYSSLCPMCKKSVLPKGYFPPVTNVMVRRERGLRRIRELHSRATLTDTQTSVVGDLEPAFALSSLRLRRLSLRSSNRHGSHVELREVPTLNADDTMHPAASSEFRRPPHLPHNEWAQQRAAALAHGDGVPSDEEERLQELERPRCKHILFQARRLY